MKKGTWDMVGVFFILALSLGILGCPVYSPPIVFSGQAIIKGEIKKATLTWDRNHRMALLQVPSAIQTEYAIRYLFAFKEEDLSVEKTNITPSLNAFIYTATVFDAQKEIHISIIQQPKNGDSRWPCHHEFDDQVIAVQIKSVRFVARTIVARKDNPLNPIRDKYFPCP